MEAGLIMSTGFAGSARLGERRRRRLATETIEPGKGRRRHRVDPAHVDSPDDVPLVAIESPLHAWLPQRRGWLVVATAASFVGLVVALWVALRAELDPRWQQLVGIKSGHLISTLGTLLLAGSAQWCWVIYWYRKRGRRDFRGDYRRWLLAGLTFLLALPCWTANIHLEFAKAIRPFVSEAASSEPDLCWMVPFGTAAALYAFGLLREMLPLRLRGLLLVGGLGWLAFAAALLLCGESVMASAACRLASMMATVVALWCFFHCLWLQARHVVRVSNEPPQSGPLQPLALRQAVESSLTAVERSGQVATAPYRVVREALATWQMQRAERSEQKAADKQARLDARTAAKAAAQADREAAKAAKAAEREAAAEAKAEAKRRAAAEKQEAAEARAAAKAARKSAAVNSDESMNGNEEEADDRANADDHSETAHEDAVDRRGRRKKRGRPTPTLNVEAFTQPASDESDEQASDGSPAEAEEDLSHLSRKERRRLRKQRRDNS